MTRGREALPPRWLRTLKRKRSPEPHKGKHSTPTAAVFSLSFVLMLCRVGSMDSQEEIAAAALLQLSYRIYEESRLSLSWGRTRKRNACKRIDKEEKPSPNEKSGERWEYSTPPPAARESQGPLESKRKRKTVVKRTQKNMKLAELQDKYTTFSMENARLREELDRYLQMRASLHADNVLLKNECPTMKNATLTEIDNGHAVNLKEKEELKGKENIKKEKFVLPDLNVPLEDPFYGHKCSEAPLESNVMNIVVVALAPITIPTQECTSALSLRNVAAEARKQRMEYMRLKLATTSTKKWNKALV